MFRKTTNLSQNKCPVSKIEEYHDNFGSCIVSHASVNFKNYKLRAFGTPSKIHPGKLTWISKIAYLKLKGVTFCKPIILGIYVTVVFGVYMHEYFGTQDVFIFQSPGYYGNTWFPLTLFNTFGSEFLRRHHYNLAAISTVNEVSFREGFKQPTTMPRNGKQGADLKTLLCYNKVGDHFI